MPASLDHLWGYYAQAGYLFPSQVEVVGRYGEFRPRGETDPSIAERHHELGGGLNYYWHEHDLELQADYFYLWQEDTAAARHQVRVQLQLAYRGERRTGRRDRAVDRPRRGDRAATGATSPASAAISCRAAGPGWPRW